MFDGIPDALAGDAEIFGNLGEGKILVVIFGENAALTFGEHRAVMVQQDGKFQILHCLCHGGASCTLQRTVVCVKFVSLQLVIISKSGAGVKQFGLSNPDYFLPSSLPGRGGGTFLPGLAAAGPFFKNQCRILRTDGEDML